MTKEPPTNAAAAVENPDAPSHPDPTDVSTTVVLEVAAAEDMDPLAMEDTLTDWIDPDALDAIVSSMTEGSVTFSMRGHEVRVDADGTVAVDGRSPTLATRYRS